MIQRKTPDYSNLVNLIRQYAEIKNDYGAKNVASILDQIEESLWSGLINLKNLPIDPIIAQQEPDDLPSIQNLRPEGPRRLWQKFDLLEYVERLEGALLGRLAGCTLGAPVEGWSIDRMVGLARETGEKFPPTDYWSYIPNPYAKRYGVSPNETYTRGKMNGVPVDDDLAYTPLGLLIMEEYGPYFTTEEVSKAWMKCLPLAVGPEGIALDHIKKGSPAFRAAEEDNPYWEGLGACIRCDPWGYLAPGWPERAAQMAYQDAFLSHRRQGVYDAMFFAASISAAFAVEDPLDALQIGLTEIPAESNMAKMARWALEKAPEIQNYQQARDAVDERFKGLHEWHALPNACLTIWGIAIGGNDFTRVIGETVAMGWDNDCTAATAGSLAGAIVGKKGIPEYWYQSFHDTLNTYLIGYPAFSIRDLIQRYTIQATRIYNS